MHPDDLHDRHGIHGRLGNRFLRWHTCLARLAHCRNGNWLVVLHDKWDNRGLVRREFYANLGLSLCDDRRRRDANRHDGRQNCNRNRLRCLVDIANRMSGGKITDVM